MNRTTDHPQPPHEHPLLKGGPAQIVSSLRCLMRAGDVIELRILGVPSGEREHEYNGYYDYEHIKELAKEACRYTQRTAGCYVTLNPVQPDLLSRRSNCTARAKSGEATNDGEILNRRWILIDVDPVRSSGISSTAAEKESAHRLTCRIRELLDEQGHPPTIVADSGNGYHLLYACELPANDDRLVQRFLSWLAKRFDCDTAKVDPTVHNPARISRLYGTLARKGDHSPKRPHRQSRVLEFLESAPLSVERADRIAPWTSRTAPPPGSEKDQSLKGSRPRQRTARPRGAPFRASR